jgi:hypothetical protein
MSSLRCRGSGAPSRRRSSVGFVQAVRTCLKKYDTFTGTATRPECWLFFLFNEIGSLLFALGGTGLGPLVARDAATRSRCRVAAPPRHRTVSIIAAHRLDCAKVDRTVPGGQGGGKSVCSGGSRTNSDNHREVRAGERDLLRQLRKDANSRQEFCASCGAKRPD